MNSPLLHTSIRQGSEKRKIWQICDRLYAEHGRLPSGNEVVKLYVAEGGNQNTGFTQYSHWKKALAGGEAEQKPVKKPAKPGKSDHMPLSVGPDGRILIPAHMREAMMLDPDGRVTAWVENGQLHVVSPMVAIRQAQELVKRYKKPGESVVDEFLAERRAMWGEQ